MTDHPAPSARALASRRNGARSRGPVTPAGKARSARNALRHGLAARTLAVLDDEDAAGFDRLKAALCTELAPEGALQSELVARIALAAWRTRRSDRIEAELFANHLAPAGGAPAGIDRGAGPGADLGFALIRDGHGPRAVEILLRYRGCALAELFRALAALKALQAEGATGAAPAPMPPNAKRTREGGEFE